jgi:hypothetical protein
MSLSGFKFVTGEDRQKILAPGVRLTFLRAGDRWSHALAVGDGDQNLLAGIAESVESDPDRDDPARVVSPAYQEVQPHFAEGNVCALLTGQSTPHHFSAVVTARSTGEVIVIEFDVADRCRALVSALASTYLVRLGPGALIDAGSHRIVWQGDELGRGRLEFLAEAPNCLSLAEAGRQASRVQAIARIDPSTFTQRLGYRWRWTRTSQVV